MDQWLRAIEQLGLVQAVKTSFIAYPLINAAHILAVGALVTCVILMDLRLLGRFPALPQDAFVTLLRRVALCAFLLAVLTGAIMFAIRATEYAAMPVYWIKMGLIALAGVNFAIFQMLDRREAPAERRSAGLQISAALSILLWLSALIAGRFIGFA